MNEEYEGSHTPVDLRKPQSGADGQDAFAAYQDQNGAQQGPAQDLPQEGIYKAGTHQKQGEYHDTSQDWNSTYSQEAKGQEYRQAYEHCQPGVWDCFTFHWDCFFAFVLYLHQYTACGFGSGIRYPAAYKARL